MVPMVPPSWYVNKRVYEIAPWNFACFCAKSSWKCLWQVQQSRKSSPLKASLGSTAMQRSRLCKLRPEDRQVCSSVIFMTTVHALHVISCLLVKCPDWLQQMTYAGKIWRSISGRHGVKCLRASCLRLRVGVGPFRYMITSVRTISVHGMSVHNVWYHGVC